MTIVVLLTVGLYDVNDGKGTCILHGHTGGVTQVKFTTDGYYLISGARKVKSIQSPFFIFNLKNPYLACGEWGDERSKSEWYL